jgi:hypothetical protein
MANHRLFPPVSVGAQVRVTSGGRAYSGTPGQVVDVNESDSPTLQASGWTFVSLVGTTAQRPTTSSAPQPVQPGLRFYDTTLSKMIVADSGLTWRDPLNGSAV